jgi:hypothetical protein
MSLTILLIHVNSTSAWGMLQSVSLVSSLPNSQSCQQSIQINLINQAVTICTASQANPAYRKIAVNQAQNCQID